MATNKLSILRYYRDLPVLLKNMRAKDIAELKNVAVSFNTTIKNVLYYLIDNSIEPKSVFYGDKLLICAGQCTLEGSETAQIGDVWLFSTKWADKYPLAYTKACKELLDTERRRFKKGVYICTSSQYPEAMRINDIIGFKKTQTAMDINGVTYYVYFAEGL